MDSPRARDRGNAFGLGLRSGDSETTRVAPNIPRARGVDRQLLRALDVTASQDAMQALDMPSYLAEGPVAARTLDARPPRVGRRLLHQPGLLLSAQVLSVFVVGLLVMALVRADPLVTAVVLLFTLVLKYHAGHSVVRPGLPHLGKIATDMALPLAAVALGVAYSGVPRSNVRDAVSIIAAITCADLAGTLLRRRFEGPTRIVIVGDRDAITKAATQWAGHSQAQVVGGLLLSADMDDDQQPISDTMGVRTIRGIGEVVRWVEHWAADMVVVTPGPGVASEDLRSLSWGLEATDAALAVSGILDSVAPHRIDTTTFAGINLIQTRSSRPSAFIRATKWTIDRFVGSLLLFVASPFLVLSCLCIRMDSPGRALFKQVRVGQNGRTFTMYKLRTMHADSEAALASLVDADEGNGVLFKMRKDPRVTRVGRLLRKTSMDELPQLINVALGQMSLVGPRPALPREVERYDDLARRRMAVRPGMTGLWQVSGRSDLAWDKSIELDLNYTDNYRLADDVLIALRTVGAVVRPNGAY